MSNIGELFENLCKLEIKLEKNDHDVSITQKTIDTLRQQLGPTLETYSFWYRALKTVLRELDKSENTHINEHLQTLCSTIKKKLNSFDSKSNEEPSQKGLFITTPISLQDVYLLQPLLYYLILLFENLYLIPANFDLSEVFDLNIHLISAKDVESLKKEVLVYSDELYQENILEKFHLNKNILDVLKPNRMILMSHLGLGDMICLNGAVNYLTEQCDEFYIVSFRDNYKNVRMLYSETNHKVKIFDFDQKIHSNRTFWQFLESQLSSFFTTTYKTGHLFHSYAYSNNLPAIFYEEMKISPYIRKTHTNIPHMKESLKLYETIKGIPYIFVHQNSSDRNQKLIKWDIQSILTIDPNENNYKPGDSYFELAELFVNKPYLYYVDTIQNTSKLYLLNSSFSSLAINIPNLKAIEKKIFCRYTAKELDLDYLYIDSMKEKTA